MRSRDPNPAQVGTDDARMRQVGIPGVAMVVGVTDTGEGRDSEPVLEIDLTVAPRGGAAFDVRILSSVDAGFAATCVPGRKVAVLVDPADRRRVWVDWRAEGEEHQR